VYYKTKHYCVFDKNMNCPKSTYFLVKEIADKDSIHNRLTKIGPNLYHATFNGAYYVINDDLVIPDNYYNWEIWHVMSDGEEKKYETGTYGFEYAKGLCENYNKSKVGYYFPRLAK